MNIKLAYGRGHLSVELPDKRTTVIEPSHTPGLADERAAVVASVEKPIGAPPLRDLIRPDRPGVHWLYGHHQSHAQ